jgi:hypothetical protein
VVIEIAKASAGIESKAAAREKRDAVRDVVIEVLLLVVTPKTYCEMHAKGTRTSLRHI